MGQWLTNKLEQWLNNNLSLTPVERKTMIDTTTKQCRGSDSLTLLHKRQNVIHSQTACSLSQFGDHQLSLSSYSMRVQHYGDVVMTTMASQITTLTIVYSTVYSGADQRKHQSSASLAFVQGIHRGPVNSPHKWPVTRKMFPFDDVIMGFKWQLFPHFRLKGLRQYPDPDESIAITKYTKW